MKKIYILLFNAILTISAQAQWTNLGVVGSNTVRAVNFLNPDTGLVADFAGTISKTTDGGTTWTHPTSGVAVQLRSIDYIDENTVFICGGGVLLKSTDAGDTWTSLTSPSIYTMRAIDFVNADTGFIAGSSGIIFRTYDGGTTWTSYTLSETTSDVIQLQMADASVGYAVCAGSSSPFPNGYVFKTEDGGDTWTQVYYDANIGFLGLTVVDAETVLAGGQNQVIIYSGDGGSSWAQVYSGLSGYAIRAGTVAPNGDIYMADDGLNGTADAYVLKSPDGGSTWIGTTLSGALGLFALSFPTSSIGYAGDYISDVWKYECLVPATADLSSDPLTICSGDTLTFTISEIEGATGYKWILPDEAYIINGDGTTNLIVVFGSVSGDISVFATGACVDGEAAFESITVNITPAVPSITFNSGILTSSASSGNQWYYNGSEIPGAVNQTYTPTQNGTYSVIVTSTEGCSSQSEPLEVIGVGVDETIATGFAIAPNPMNSFTQINVSNPDADRLVVTDVQGKVIINATLGASRTIMLEKDNLTSGMYMIQLLNNKNELLSHAKLIVQ